MSLGSKVLIWIKCSDRAGAGNLLNSSFWINSDSLYSHTLCACFKDRLQSSKRMVVFLTDSFFSWGCDPWAETCLENLLGSNLHALRLKNTLHDLRGLREDLHVYRVNDTDAWYHELCFKRGWLSKSCRVQTDLLMKYILSSDKIHQLVSRYTVEGLLTWRLQRFSRRFLTRS